MRYTEINEGSMSRRYGGPRRTPIETQEAFEFIKANCMQAYNADPIYRGVTRNSPGVKIVDSTNAAPRKSANTKSYVGILMDTLPEWAAYPKRSKSFICSSSISYAQAYGVVHRVFPVDGTKIGVCRERDIWETFHNFDVPKLIFALDTIGQRFLGTELSEVPSEFYKQLDELTHHIDNVGGLARLGDFPSLRSLIKMSTRLGTNDLRTVLTKMVDPEDNDFRLLSMDGFTSNASQEVWFEGKAIMVPRSLWFDFNEFMKS